MKHLIKLFTLLISYSLIGQIATSDFVTTWNTNVPGTANPHEIYIHTDPNYVYDYDIDWDNDGNFDEFNLVGDAVHEYHSPIIQTIRIRGHFPSIKFGVSDVKPSDNEKIIEINQWGEIQWEDLQNAFEACINLTSTATDAPIFESLSNSSLSNMLSYTKFNSEVEDWNIGLITDLSYMFNGNTEFNQPLETWDVSNVVTMAYMFSGASSFNQSLVNWNISGIRSSSTPAYDSMRGMLNNSGLSMQNYDKLLIFLAAKIRAFNVTLGVDGLTYCSGAAARYELQQQGWTFNGDVVSNTSCQVTLGTEDNNLQTIKTYPNPNNGRFTISLNSPLQEGTISLHNLSGQRVYSSSLNQELEHNVDLDLAAGIYLLYVHSGEYNYTEKLVVQ